jgi:hypothetical protein
MHTELANGAYRLVRHAVSGRVQYSRLVGDQEYTIWSTGGQHGKPGGGWSISCGQKVFYAHSGSQHGYFSSLVSRMASSPDREATGMSDAAAGPPEEGWAAKTGKLPLPRVVALDASDAAPPPSPLINFARLRVHRLGGDEFTITLARRPVVCAPEGGGVFFGSEGQLGTPLMIINGCGLADAAAGVPVAVALASSLGSASGKVRVLTLEAPALDDGVPVSPLGSGRSAPATMREKLDGEHCSQMMVLHDTGVLVCDADSAWWQLSAEGGRGGAAVFVPHRGNFVGSSPLPSAPASGGSGFLPTLMLGR